MIPFDIIHEDLLPLDIGHLDDVFEQHPNFSTLAKWPIYLSLLILISLDCNLLAHELLDVEEVFAE